jgi:hypothetical protein
LTFTAAGQKPAGEGWTSLFNGKDLTGWITPPVEHTWKVLDGVIDYEAKGDNLTSAKEYKDYVLHLEWRFKRTEGEPYSAKLFNPDGSIKVDENGKEIRQLIANADSGILIRGTGISQVNLWCWPCGSGELWSFKKSEDPAIRAGALPKVKADKPVGEWNTMQIAVKGEHVSIVLNGQQVIDTSMPGIGTSGPICLQHHGGYNEEKKEWSSASALIQFRNIWIKEF